MMPAHTRIRRLAEAFLAMTLVGMVACVFGNVVLRYVFGTGIVIAEELSRLLFVWMVSIGAIVAAADHQHLALDLLTSRLGVTARKVLAAAVTLVIAFVLCVLIWGSWQQMVVGWSSYSPVMKYPQALLAGATWVMSVVMLIALLAQSLGAASHALKTQASTPKP